MYVVNTRADLVRVTIPLEGLKEFHITLGSLDGDNIGVKSLDGRENVSEIRVAEVRVGLQLVSNAGCRKLERVNRPFEVGVPVSTTKRQLDAVSLDTEHSTFKSLTPSRIAGSSTWIAWIPAFSRSTTSSRRASASCLD